MSRLIFLIGLLVILWLPMLQMATGFSQNTLNENRKLAPAPVMDSWSKIDQFASDTVKWFNDHFGFRDFLIKAKTQIDYSVFGMSTRIHVGNNGWLFYRSVMDVQKPHIELFLRKEADTVIEGTRQLAAKLKARGVKLIVMIAPMKDVYYSEHLPTTAKQLPTPRQVDLLQDRLRSMKEIIFIDSTKILQELSTKRNVFHKTDFHWNDPAAFDVARYLVNELGKLEGKINPVWTHKLEIEKKSYSGGIASFMPIFFPPRENGLFVKKNWNQPPYHYMENKPPFEWVSEIKEPTGHELKPITILGDSFFDGMIRSGIGVYFNKVYRASNNSTNLKNLVSNLPADSRYLFIEFIEVGAGYEALASVSNQKIR